MRYLPLALLPLLAACSGGGDNQAAETKGAGVGESIALTGEQIFARCSACHKVAPDGSHGIGPNLHGVVGRAIASQAGFAYSAALQAKTGNWDDANLDAYLTDPRAFAPGNRMSFAGIKDAGERKTLIEWLKTQK